MPIVPSSNRPLLLEMPADRGLESLSQALSRRPGLESMIAAQPGGSAWQIGAVESALRSEHPWDQAHRAVADLSVVGLEAATPPQHAEPDFVQRFPYGGPDDTPVSALDSASPCQQNGPNAFWPPSPENLRFAWHLEEALQILTGGADPLNDKLDNSTPNRLIAALRESPLISRALHDHLTTLLGRI
jgi:hypothetical protein